MQPFQKSRNTLPSFTTIPKSSERASARFAPSRNRQMKITGGWRRPVRWASFCLLPHRHVSLSSSTLAHTDRRMAMPSHPTDKSMRLENRNDGIAKVEGVSSIGSIGFSAEPLVSARHRTSNVIALIQYTTDSNAPTLRPASASLC